MAQTITLNFKIIGQSLERLDDNRIVEKAKNYVNAHFEFNELWDDTTKAILIDGSGLRYKVYLNENNECSIPNRVVRHDGFTLTVVGEDTDKNITITTNDLFISILNNNATDDTPSYVEEIESETLDVTREGEKYNIEIPESYKNCYIVTSNDISNITPISSGTYNVTLSEEMESVITTFKQNLYIDWENQFPDILSTLQGIKLTNCYPSKKFQIDAELETFYVFSATDGWNDFNMTFYYVNDTWRVSFTMGNLATQEYVSMEVSMAVADKSKVVANVETTEDTPTLSSIGIDGVPFKVGGGSKLYRHTINETGRWISLTIITKSDTAFTKTSLAQWLYTNGYNSLYNRYTATNNAGSAGSITSGVYSEDGIAISCLTSGGTQPYTGDGFVDVISEV